MSCLEPGHRRMVCIAQLRHGNAGRSAERSHYARQAWPEGRRGLGQVNDQPQQGGAVPVKPRRPHDRRTMAPSQQSTPKGRAFMEGPI